MVLNYIIQDIMRSETAAIRGIPVRIYSDGEPEHAVLAIHGFGGSKDSIAIRGLAERICGKGFMIAAPDLPCHGDRSEDERELTPERCVNDIMEIENWLHERSGGDISAFATSFGAGCILQRLELRESEYRRVVLRVPAVNMADSLLRCMRLFQPDFTLEQARREGFHVKMSRELNIPFSFYEHLLGMNEVRHSDSWNSPDIMTIYSGRDELVARADTEEFLRLNPLIQSLCIEESGHRMAVNPENLAKALDKSANFLTE